MFIEMSLIPSFLKYIAVYEVYNLLGFEIWTWTRKGLSLTINLCFFIDSVKNV
jgi:hypothetical protein